MDEFCQVVLPEDVPVAEAGPAAVQYRERLGCVEVTGRQVSAYFLGNVAGLLVVLTTVPVFAAILRVPFSIVAPVILVICAVGAFTVHNALLDISVMLVFGVVGYLFKKLSYPLAPLVLALVLGDMAESSFRQAMLLSQGSLSIFWSNPLVGSLVLLALLLLFWPAISLLLARLNAARPRRREAVGRRQRGLTPDGVRPRRSRAGVARLRALPPYRTRAPGASGARAPQALGTDERARPRRVAAAEDRAARQRREPAVARLRGDQEAPSPPWTFTGIPARSASTSAGCRRTSASAGRRSAAR